MSMQATSCSAFSTLFADPTGITPGTRVKPTRSNCSLCASVKSMPYGVPRAIGVQATNFAISIAINQPQKPRNRLDERIQLFDGLDRIVHGLLALLHGRHGARQFRSLLLE